MVSHEQFAEMRRLQGEATGMMDGQFPGRGTGRTTRQMRGAPHGAAFIWCNDHLFYPRSLARWLGRDDLRIFGPSALDWGDHLRGSGGLVLDHDCRLTEQQAATARKLEPYLNRAR